MLTHDMCLRVSPACAGGDNDVGDRSACAWPWAAGDGLSTSAFVGGVEARPRVVRLARRRKELATGAAQTACVRSHPECASITR